MALTDVEQSIADRVVRSLKDGASKDEIRESLKKEVLKEGYLKEDRQVSFAVERMLNEFTTGSGKRHWLGVLSIIAAFVYPPFGSIVGLILGLLSYFDEDDSREVAGVGIVFSLMTFVVFGGLILWAAL